MQSKSKVFELSQVNSGQKLTGETERDKELESCT